MVKRNKDAHQSNHYKSTNNSGGKANKKSGGKAGKGNKTINKFLGIGKPGPHLLKHKKLQEAKKAKRQTQRPSSDTGKSRLHSNSKTAKQDSYKINNKKLGKSKHSSSKSSYKNGDNGEGSSTGKRPQRKSRTDYRSYSDLEVPDSMDDSMDDSLDEYEQDIEYQYEQDSDNLYQPLAHQRVPQHQSQEMQESKLSSGSTSTAPLQSEHHSDEDSESKKEKKEKKERKQRTKEQKEARKLRKAEKKLEKNLQKLGKLKEDRERREVMKLEPVQVDAKEKSAADDKPQLDDMETGADFIPFSFEDTYEEPEPEPVVAPVVPVFQENMSENRHGQKRKRDLDYGSDTEGSTGPPPGCPWMGHRQYTKLSSVPVMLTQELKDFVDYISPTREEHQVRKYVLQRVEMACRALWVNVKVEIFGSYDTQLYLPSSDLDIVVIRDKEFDKDDLYRLSRHLRSSGVAQDITVIAKARVPIVKFKETISKLPVDISFNVLSGMESARIVKRYLSEWPVLRPFTLLIKHFLMVKGYNEVFHGGIGSYTAMIMILSFLQMHPQIQSGVISPDDNLGVLLIEFFELYGLCFNYQKVGLKVADGGSYFVKEIPPQVQQWGRRQELILSSIDPNDASNNTARGSYQLNKIREVFVGAYGTLTQTVLKRNMELFGGKDGQAPEPSRHVRFDDHNRVPADSVEKSSGLHQHTQVSLIKEVFSLPFEMRESRRQIEVVFYEGHYQDIFNDPRGISGLRQMDGY
ncbi:hypothetical protein KVV02_006767 [Mortierella alpina]|uniref:polynucleotide adenylyltransferase n=1 Tax=Mortierella alpina TaxID=64518 RepID=A0A9P8D1R9_MORAP|nr:hypothetical protein KVV02_006767 [Mortierella alpina]